MNARSIYADWQISVDQWGPNNAEYIRELLVIKYPQINKSDIDIDQINEACSYLDVTLVIASLEDYTCSDWHELGMMIYMGI